VKTESANNFPRVRKGYDPLAVDAYIDELAVEQQSLREEAQALRTRLTQSSDEAAALRKEVAVLQDTSPSPHAMPHRIAKMLRITVDEVAAMQAEAQSEAEALIAATEAEADTARRRHKELLADIAAQRGAHDAEREKAEKELDAELARMRAETEAAIDEAWEDAERQRQELLRDARHEADYYLDQARHAVEDAKQQRAKILEQVASVYRGLETVPAALESAHRDRDRPQNSAFVVPFDENATGR
jgi:chromosome segregation ATPase